MQPLHSHLVTYPLILLSGRPQKWTLFGKQERKRNKKLFIELWGCGFFGLKFSELNCFVAQKSVIPIEALLSDYENILIQIRLK